ncbi:large conductance mechanosensitive channel protein MscL [Caproiciproducens sp. NJN-50]|uniref:large conductance mechanosensitive channel protein MscL n=1 Tax=Acutalibacteraceae TaxID=3082771 RepID=UPI000FFE2579|nr:MULTISPECIES: large conductance mechanosensitive channel protein MscL [Acutalibacteraceae]QAT50811.1 large conductance mechanosensitive channel protein MscL [Caproiciproducens sp. NJN-50]
MLKEFKEFISRGNVMDLAIGVMIGAAFSSIVSSVVNDLITPVIGAVFGKIDFSNLYLVLDGKSFPSLSAAKEAGAPVLAYGSFLTAVINFLIIAFCVFLLSKAINRLVHRNEADQAEETVAQTKICPFCKTEIPRDATRCPNCTSELAD